MLHREDEITLDSEQRSISPRCRIRSIVTANTRTFTLLLRFSELQTKLKNRKVHNVMGLKHCRGSQKIDRQTWNFHAVLKHTAANEREWKIHSNLINGKQFTSVNDYETSGSGKSNASSKDEMKLNEIIVKIDYFRSAYSEKGEKKSQSQQCDVVQTTSNSSPQPSTADWKGIYYSRFYFHTEPTRRWTNTEKVKKIFVIDSVPLHRRNELLHCARWRLSSSIDNIVFNFAWLASMNMPTVARAGFRCYRFNCMEIILYSYIMRELSRLSDGRNAWLRITHFPYPKIDIRFYLFSAVLLLLVSVQHQN